MSSFSFSVHDAPAPVAAIEIAGTRVTGICLEQRGARAFITAHATEMLPGHCLVPALNVLNVRDRGPVAAAVARVLEGIGRPSRIGLVLGDPVAKVSLVRLQQVPARAEDLDQVLRWQVRKSAPFAIEDAQIGFHAALRTEDGQEFIVTMARRDVIAEYEQLCAAEGAHAGIVDLSTFNVVNTVLASGAMPPGDWLMVNVAPDWESVAIMRGTELIFFRSRGADGEGTLADLVHQTSMYYEDRLNGSGFSRVMLGGAVSVGGTEALRRTLGERLGAAVDVIDPTRAAQVAEPGSVDAAFLDAVTPLVGLLLRTRKAA